MFDSAGRLASSTTAADDGTAPTSVNYGWSGTPLRLRTITDPVSGRALSIRYGGDAGCPGGAPAGFDATAPASMVCAVVYPDATQTKLWYVAKQLARIQDPGGAGGDVISDFAYSGGLLTKVRDPLAADAVAAAVAPDDDTSRSIIAYDPSSSWVASVSLAAPSTGAPRPAHSYERPALTEARVRVGGRLNAVWPVLQFNILMGISLVLAGMVTRLSGPNWVYLLSGGIFVLFVSAVTIRGARSLHKALERQRTQEH